MAIQWDQMASDQGLRPGPEQELAPEKIRPICGPIPGLPAADPAWIALMAFAARYYRRPFGTIAVGLLPKWLRDIKNYAAKKEGGRSNFDRLMGEVVAAKDETPQQSSASEPALNLDQLAAFEAIQKPGVFVLHGVTGSGKTRVYTEVARRCIESGAQQQVLVMVPEIGLTPQLVARFAQALPGVEIAVLHSEVTERERARLWLSAATGRARLVIGTRLSIMTPMPHLALIIVDEEHDHSYKQQEGMRYSARDLAVWRAQNIGATLVLGSATPSIETWAQIERKKYHLLSLPHRATGEPAAPIELIDTLNDPAKEGLSQQSRSAIAQVLADGGQVLVFLNRRGYAPVLSCGSCGWSSRCPDCGVAAVLHRVDAASLATAKSNTTSVIARGEAPRQSTWRLQCHHCGIFASVPRQCPECGDSDLSPIGRGVQRLEDTLTAEFPQARILRIDRDTVKQGKALAAEIEKIERHEVDIVVGTQMLAKGHDFARMRLVVVADADTQLINADFRAPERLFATLVQVAGRAGRHGQAGSAARVLIQTRYPQHRLYRYLLGQDVAGFAKAELEDRQVAGLPPFSHMAAVRAAYRDETKTRQLLRTLRDELQQLAAEHSWPVTVYGPVARYPEMQAGKWRGQIILESGSRPALHNLLATAEGWMAQHRELDCHVDVDPVEV
ncbi:MAG: primosomal protein N' [Burkholderiaceae bacterium]|nr:primosomal protein N' [Burkholderiaceae bacterium]